MNSPNICAYVCTDGAIDPDYLSSAEAFAVREQIPFFSGDEIKNTQKPPEEISEYDFVLYYCRGCVSILQLGKGTPGPVSASFVGGKTEHRLKFGGGKGQMIAKAVGLNKGVTPHVMDATAGLGRDAFVLASLGCEVSMLERVPIVAELLRGALNENVQTSGLDAESALLLGDILSRMSLIEADAYEWLREQTDTVADVIYLDPMYPHREKSSQVKKEMRLFQSLVGENLDDACLLEAALEKARYRVVVKRPRKGEAIKGMKPSLQLIGKSCRYDIYTLKRIEDLAR